jgi:hypothetical protein
MDEPLIVPIGIRGYTPELPPKPERERDTDRPRAAGKPRSEDAIALDCLVRRDLNQTPVVGAILQISEGAVIGACLVELVTTPQHVRRQYRRLARSTVTPLDPHVVRGGVDVGTPVLSQHRALDRWFYPTTYEDLGRVECADGGFTLSRFAKRRWSPKSQTGTWRFGMLGGPRDDRAWSAYPGTPDLVALRRGEAWELRFASQSKNAVVKNRDGEAVSAVAYELDGRQYRGRFEDVLQAARALIGEDLDLGELAARLDTGMEVGSRTIEGEWPTDAELDRLLDRVLAIHLCRDALQRHIDRVHHDAGVELHQLQSVATVARGYLVISGIEAAPELDAHNHAIAAATYMGGRIESSHLRTRLPVLVADRSVAYLRDAVAIEAERMLASPELVTRDPTPWLRRLVRGDLLAKTADLAVCTRMAKISVLVEPDGEALTFRPWLKDRASPSLVTAPLHAGGPMWIHAFELCSAALASGRSPKILGAIEFVPRASRHRLPVSFAGQPPKTGGLFEAALALDLAAATDPSVQLFAVGIKGSRASMPYGLACQVIRHAGTKVEQIAHTPWDETTFTGPVEEPGKHLCFVVASAVAAFARFQLRRVETKFAAVGGSIVQMDTDGFAACATEAGGLVRCLGGELRDNEGRECIYAPPIAEVLRILDEEAWANPMDGGTAWRIQYDSDTRPTFLYSLGHKRYSVFHRGPNGEIELRFASEIVLGGRYLCPYGTEERGSSRARRWVEDLWRHEIDPERYPRPWWWRVPAIRTVTLDRPAVLDSWKGSGLTIPFGQVCQSEPAPVVGQAPGPIAPWRADPRAVTGWIHPATGASVRVGLEPDAYAGITSAECVIATLGCVASRWVDLRDLRSQPVSPAQDRSASVGVMRPRVIHTTPALTVIIGKESASWGLGFSGVIDPWSDEWLSELGSLGDPVRDILVPAVERIAAQIGITGVALEARCSPKTLHVLTKDTWPSVLERVRAVACDHALAALGRDRGPRIRRSEISARASYALIEAWLRTDREGQVCRWEPCSMPVSGSTYCRAAHRVAAWRKADRERLAALGMRRCSKCGAIRSGDTTGPCPACRGARPATARECRVCHARFIPRVPDPCPICERSTR